MIMGGVTHLKAPHPQYIHTTLGLIMFSARHIMLQILNRNLLLGNNCVDNISHRQKSNQFAVFDDGYIAAFSGCHQSKTLFNRLVRRNGIYFFSHQLTHRCFP